MKSLQGQGRGVLAIHLNRSTFFGPFFVDKTDEMFFSIKAPLSYCFYVAPFTHSSAEASSDLLNEQ